ncbi:MAG: TM0106 family RecB-like putative nuclease [Sphingomonas sp.]
MLRYAERTLYSASDLVNFMGCAHATFLDVGHLTNPGIIFAPDDESAVLLQEKGIEHEQAYLAALRAEGRSVAEIAPDATLDERAERTRDAMRQGIDVVYQGAFVNGAWHGYSDFLLRVDGVNSDLGSYAYEVADTKLSRSAKPKHLLQLCVYADLLAHEQGVLPPRMHVVLGDGTIASLRTSAVIHYFTVARTRFEAFAASPPATSNGDPCGHCTFCRWSETCDGVWEAADHPSIVAGMSRGQIEALRAVGINSLVQLAAMPDDARVVGIQGPTLAKLKAQARLQAHQRATGERLVELLAGEAGRGFARLPRPDEGDLFFDMEGDPLFDNGLEYLFGIVTVDGGSERFHAFWAHDREAEKKAFQDAIDMMSAQFARYPRAHIYHYAAYEETALKRLAMYHGTREAEVDDLLRGGKLVDLYQVVREAIRTSEPGYSIKNMETFYLEGGRTGEVKTAGESIVIYERWRRLGDPQFLADIASYNELDCRSTRMCRDWLLSLRPDGSRWFDGPAVVTDPAKAEARREAEERSEQMAAALLAGDGGNQRHRRLLVDLLEFHGREAKPTWWAMFARQDASHEELLEDAECIAGLSPAEGILPRPDKRSMIYTLEFPAQDFKFKGGDKPLRAGTLEPAGEIVSIDEERRIVELKLGPTRNRLETGAALIPEGPVGDKPLREAIYRYAEAAAAGDEGRFAAITAILRRDPPRLTGRPEGAALVPDGIDATEGAIAALRQLDHSYLLVQGPPGAGKTYTSSQAIVALLAEGRRIGVASNSHKAINNLLTEVEAMATAQGLHCRGVKKSSREDQMLNSGGWITDTLANEGVTGAHQLVAGTAWLFARPEHELAFDYLFVDEAGQVGLANIVAMGVAARNIVLVGDQMQLSQPVKGTHPRDSGLSALDHLLEDNATVPPEQGVFLPITRRMHPDLCRFISDAVYDGRLRSEASTANQRLEIDLARDPEALAPAGFRFVTVDHLGCTQRSPAEAERLAVTYDALLGSAWTDRHGVSRPIGADDILVVSPYNMQVELLRRVLPDGARVGTVDKFQGQEAPVVLVSMATSSGDDLPRNIEFLYSRNRLNVAISRARCLAVIFANPRLLEIPCSTITQMELVDGLCWAKQFADHQRAEIPAPNV